MVFGVNYVSKVNLDLCGDTAKRGNHMSRLLVIFKLKCLLYKGQQYYITTESYMEIKIGQLTCKVTYPPSIFDFFDVTDRAVNDVYPS